MRKIRLQRNANDRLREAFERDLNETQRAAATAPDGFNLIIAGPGSGKTRVITYRVAYLIAKGVPAESILLVTFTRRAAREMVGRLESLIGPPAAQVWAGTFHHIGNRILRRRAERLGYKPNFTILDTEDQQDLLKLALDDSGLVGLGKLAPKPSMIHSLISFSKNVGVPLSTIIADRAPGFHAFTDQIVSAAAAYEKRKQSANALDYDDLLVLWSRLVAEYPDERERQARLFQHILVDEMQDTNRLQVELVESIARAGNGNLTAVGDDAQSIYRFRGANYDNILRFHERNPGANVIRLEVNYRSTPAIVAFTNASIACNRTGFPKALVSAREGGARPLVIPAADVHEEADVICDLILEARDEGTPLPAMSVLYRNHHDSILIQAKLVERGIPYSVRSGLRFFEQAHIKDVLAYLRVLVNPLDETAWRRLLLLLPGIGPAKAGALFEWVSSSSDPLLALELPETMARVPTKSRGPFAAFVADIRKVRAVDPEANPAAAIAAILQGGYSQSARDRFDRAENRLADIEQLGVLAARYDSLEKLIADLLLAGDVYGMDTLAAEDEGEALVLSTIHQAKGLEWSRVFMLRLVEDAFPSARALKEPEGEEEERRIFYVGITRAQDVLVLVHPKILTGPGRDRYVIARPSRFLEEIDATLWEEAVVETDIDLAWTSVPRTTED